MGFNTLTLLRGYHQSDDGIVYGRLRGCRIYRWAGLYQSLTSEHGFPDLPHDILPVLLTY